MGFETQGNKNIYFMGIRGRIPRYIRTKTILRSGDGSPLGTGTGEQDTLFHGYRRTGIPYWNGHARFISRSERICV